MNHSVDQNGNICLPPSLEEARCIQIALQSRHVLLRKANGPEETCDLVISMIVTLNDALVKSNKAKLLDAIPPRLKARPHQPLTCNPQSGFWRSIRNYFYPPFSILDFETADTISGAKHIISDMEFEPGTRYPIRVKGLVQYNGQFYKASWDSHGYCSCKVLDPFVDANFHLVRFDPRETSSTKSVVLQSNHQ